MSKKDDYANDCYTGITIMGMSHTDKGGTDVPTNFTTQHTTGVE